MHVHAVVSVARHVEVPPYAVDFEGHPGRRGFQQAQPSGVVRGPGVIRGLGIPGQQTVPGEAVADLDLLL